jgi:ubiquitin-like modifier-activating enzyme ATG7
MESKFQPFRATIEPAFLKAIGDLKLASWRLSEAPEACRGKLLPSLDAALPGTLRLDPESFAPHSLAAAGSDRLGCDVPGLVVCCNTLESFKSWDKAALLRQVADEIWADIAEGRATTEPERLHRFVVLAHADVKRHRFVVWPAFPALFSNKSHSALPLSRAPEPIAEFILRHREALSIEDVSRSLDALRSDGSLPCAFGLRVSRDSTAPVAVPLSVLEAESGEDCLSVLCVLDTGSLPDTAGWQLRNAFVWASARARHLFRSPDGLALVAFRPSKRGGFDERSVVFHVSSPLELAAEHLECSGWELQPVKGSLLPRPRLFDLSSLFDPSRLAETAGRLNLSLMKWRVMPELNQEKLEGLRCLLLGAGTLGCFVARSLMSWGVRHITFVDSGTVSHSNPVRQPLFSFEDAVKGSSKAEVAAESLRRIFPLVDSRGVVLQIPMPGHAEVRVLRASYWRDWPLCLCRIWRGRSGVEAT